MAFDLLAIEALPVEAIYGLLLLLGLCVGSFLNVVSLRLPLMLIARWREEASELASEPLDEPLPEPPFNLATPASRCPACHTRLGMLDMIPVLSYCLLKGRCRHCQVAISAQYFVVEIAAALMTALPFWVMNQLSEALAVMLAGWLLLVLAIIDFRRLWLPDVLIYLLLWLGLLVNCFYLFATPVDAIIGAVAGYSSLWLLAFCFQKITGRAGIGQGDFKLLACTGAWLGFSALPNLLLVAALLGLLFAFGLMLLSKWQKGKAIAFGPWIGLSFWLHLLYGDVYFSLLLQVIKF